jgi:Fungalysin metallopeptidase (M36)/Fungalysin/Thermolysin Propeptide Motif
MASINGLKCDIEMHSEGDVPKRLYNIDDISDGVTPEEKALSLLNRIASRIKIHPDLSGLKFDKVEIRDSVLGRHVLYQQFHNDIPISDAWVRVDLDKNGRVYNIRNDLVPEALVLKIVEEKGSPIPRISESIAHKLAACSLSTRALREGGSIHSTELVYWRRDRSRIPVMAWKIVVTGEKPHSEWKIYVDAASGDVLDSFDLLRNINGVGKVFDPNPVAALDDITLTKISPIPDAAYRQVALLELADTGYLDGPFVSTGLTIGRVNRPDFNFEFHKTDRSFREVMVYYHIDSVQRYIQGLGFYHAVNRPTQVHCEGLSENRSFYSSVRKALFFGIGGVPDTEDAEIIVHEYGHAIQHDLMGALNQGQEAVAMGEGFSDYLAASFFADNKPARLKPAIGSWDSITANHGVNVPALRRVDSTRTYSAGIMSMPHEGGQVWSACLWELRNRIGRQKADFLALAYNSLITRNSSFKGAGNALLQADANENPSAANPNEGIHKVIITDILTHRRVFP